MHAERSANSTSVIEHALAAVERSKARRERWDREKKDRFERIQIANTRQPLAAFKPGRQLNLGLDG